MNKDRTGCLGSKIKVASGKYVDLLEPDPSTIDIETIAKSLSKICRFGGHCPEFYSVAEHCVLAAVLAQNDGLGKEALRAILLHDAAEAYINDMVKPLKMMMPAYMEVERRFEIAIGVRFGVDFGKWKELIKKYDCIMLKAEKKALWPDDTEQWEGFETVEERYVKFEFLTPTCAEVSFRHWAYAYATENVWFK
jgi:hypothetical protein